MGIKIGAIIISYNIGEQLHHTVQSIIDQVDNVLIVDNASNTVTKNVIITLEKLYKDKLNYIFNDENHGIARALNQGVDFFEKKNFSWVITLDHDSTASNNMIEKFIKSLNSFSEKDQDKIAVIGPEIYDKNLDNYTYRVDDNEIISFRDTLIQSGCMFKISVLKEAKYFDDDLFIYYVDDDTCRKIRNLDYKVIMIKDAVLYHEEGAKTYKRFLFKRLTWSGYSNFALYYIFRNSIVIYKRFKKSIYVKRLLVEGFKVMVFDPSKLGTCFRAVNDGFKEKLGRYEG